jgi:C4-dicarboxylate-specific signal transduction histidine kinase
MSSLGEMASGVGHEINNPLTIILGSIEKLKRQLRPEITSRDEIQSTLEKLSNNSNRIAKIVSGLRTFARDASQDEKTLVSANEVTRDTLDLTQERLLARGIDFRVHVEDIESKDASFWGRSIQISQILINLLNNSADAIETLKEKWIYLHFKIQNGNLIWRISDSGNGIPQNIADKMMNPFFTTKEEGKGTGLGLSISQSLAVEHGGQLKYLPLETHTTFELSIPVASEVQKKAA